MSTLIKFINILADRSLENLEHFFPWPFIITRYNNMDELNNLLENKDILLIRAHTKINADLIKNSQIKILATASSGIDHIDVESLNKLGIRCIDAKGANANAVADYVISVIAYLKSVKKFNLKNIGIIGFGMVGKKVYSRLAGNNFNILINDPFKNYLDDLKNCDLICIHANLHNIAPHASYNLLDYNFLKNLKPKTILINASRGGIVNEEAIKNFKQKIYYCTDVFLNEPNIDPDIVDFATICTPHIAGHTIEAKYNILYNLSRALHQHFKIPFLLKYDILPNNLINTDLYNPIYETKFLKNALDKKNAFLLLRKAHTFRHEYKVDICI